MRLVYIDDAQDGEHSAIAVSAVLIDAANWREAFSRWIAVRERLEAASGLLCEKEIHGTDLWGGKGDKFNAGVNRPYRVGAMQAIMDEIAAFSQIQIMNGIAPLDRQEWLWERVFTRIDRTMEEWGDVALIVCDDGKPYDDLLTRLRRHNHIHFAERVIDRPLKHIIEDIVYRDSKRSHFIQIADICSYAVLRSKYANTRHREHNVHRLIERVASTCFRAANPNDPLGIIRVS